MQTALPAQQPHGHHHNQVQASAQAAGAGTLPSGTIVRVGEYQVRVERFLSEGGFAHVYLATSATAIPKGSPLATTKHVLKRIAVPDTKGVELVGKEVEVMKLLRNHPKIVNLIEASVSEMPGGVNGSKGYEIFILMEWCAGGGIIDMMNQRLQNRLTESEILKIFGDTVEAVAHMHYQDPPLIHRDLKVENILLTPPQTFKLCDFGSTTTPIRRDKVPTAVESLQKMELEINKTTTLQYRAPELVDVWSRKGFDEKVDIWALGVLLYKLCYYTTPFEEHGPLAILNAQYKIPSYPAYSSSIKTLIAGMLQERATTRPNIYQVHEQVCQLRGTTVRLENKYATQVDKTKTHGKTGSVYDSILSSGPSPSTILTEPNLAETISPMRRGRPSKITASQGSPIQNKNINVDPPRLVKTGGDTNMSGKEWEPLGAKSGGGGELQPGQQGVSSAWPTGKSAPEDVAFGSNGGGFDDSFGGSKAASSSASSSRELRGAAGTTAFADLLPPSSLMANGARSTSSLGPMVPDALRRSAKPTSTTTGSRWNGSTSGSPALSSSPLGALARADADDMDERARFESQFPRLEDDDDVNPARLDAMKPSKSLVSSPSPTIQSTTLVPQLTGEKGPELPRRPPQKSEPRLQQSLSASLSTSTLPSASALPRRFDSSSFNSTKPDLVSRSSQTSPRLLALYQQQSGSSVLSPTEQKSRALSGLSSSSSSAPEQTSVTGQLSSNEISNKRQQSVDLLGDIDDDSPSTTTTNVLGFDGASLDKQSPGEQRQTTPSATTASDAEERRKFRPVRPTFTDGTAKTSENGRTLAATAEERFPELEEFDAPSPVSRTAGRVEAASSDEDEIEDFAPRKRPEQLQQPRSAQEQSPAPTGEYGEGGGEIDLRPALASIRKFAPTSPTTAPEPAAKSPPPILAPKPQSFKRQSQINQLVSRFDSISPSTSTESVKAKASSTDVAIEPDRERRRTSSSPPPPVPPPASTKPLHLKTASSSKPRPQFGSTKVTSSSAGVTNGNQRPPPFKPVAPPSSSLTSSGPNSPLRTSASTSSFGSPAHGGGSGIAGVKTVKRPAFGGAASNSMKPKSLTNEKASQLAPDTSSTASNDRREQEEEEEKFAGVGNMKQRWEALSKTEPRPAQAPSKVRQDWTAI
ncbi:hypothetical protein ACM66B_001243 [Microbotryomycetes sp. NB124-2]